MRAIGAATLTAIAVAAPAATTCRAADKHHEARVLAGATVGQIAVEMVYFDNPQQRPVRLLRGVPRPVAAVIRRPALAIRPQAANTPPRTTQPQTTQPQTTQPQTMQPQTMQPQTMQIVSFGTGFVSEVKVVRGGSLAAASLTQRGDSPGFNRQAGASVLRGSAVRELFSLDLFGPADGGELNRIAFAVDGVESRHGTDPRMWRPSLTGPQGPMQVSAAAAFDVGGGDRFDIVQNRLLGRAYLAQMYRRYGNWPDAIAAYNWGPGNMDSWIVGGRNTDLLPFDVARYVALVLRDALVTAGR